jgi:hypothetical protein
MSDRNGTATKKPAMGETSSDADGAAAELLRKYVDLMRAAGSPNGAWNPDPDEHLTGMLREDVCLSPNELKFIALVKSCCVRPKPTRPNYDDFGRGRTLLGWTETGKPLRLTEVMAFFGWDKGNAHKYSLRPLAYGFIRKEADGQFGLGARVQGRYEEQPEGAKSAPEEEEVVCTDNLPNYLAVEIKRFNKSDRLQFLRGWRTIRAAAQQRLNAQKKRLYDLEQTELSVHCKAFELELKRKSESAGDDAEKTEGELSVQTTSVQNGADPLYNAANGFGQTTHIRKHSTAQFPYQQSSSSSQQEHSEGTTTTDEKAFLKRVRTELVRHGALDQEILLDLVARCRAKSADCTAEEIEHFIQVKAKLIPRDVQNRIAWLRTAVPKCFEPESLTEYRRQLADAAQAAATPAPTYDLRPFEPTPPAERIEFLQKELRTLRATDPDHPRARIFIPKEIAELREKLKSERASAAGGGV